MTNPENNPYTQTVIRIATKISPFCSMAHCQPSLKISWGCVRKFLRKVASRHKDRKTNKQRRKHNLLSGGNKSNAMSLAMECETVFVYVQCSTKTKRVSCALAAKFLRYHRLWYGSVHIHMASLSACETFSIRIAFPPGAWELQTIAISMPVCLSAHISQKARVQTSSNFLCMLTVALVRSPLTTL